MKTTSPEKVFLLPSFLTAFTMLASGAHHDLFITSGQSNAIWNDAIYSGATTYPSSWAEGIRDGINASNHLINPIVLETGHGGQALLHWYNNSGPQQNYEIDFFNSSGTGILQSQIDGLMSAGDTFTFRGLFWWQGETDANFNLHNAYEGIWQNMIGHLDSDIGSSSWDYVMNTVGNGPDINDAFTDITDADSRGVLFDTQVSPYRTNPNNIHGYDHYQVGLANVALFTNSFSVPEPSSALLAGLGTAGMFLRRRR